MSLSSRSSYSDDTFCSSVGELSIVWPFSSQNWPLTMCCRNHGAMCLPSPLYMLCVCLLSPPPWRRWFFSVTSGRWTLLPATTFRETSGETISVLYQTLSGNSDSESFRSSTSKQFFIPRTILNLGQHNLHKISTKKLLYHS